MSVNSIDRYKLYFISGAVTNVLIEWLDEGAKEPPREIAALYVGYFTGGILILIYENKNKTWVP